MLNAFVKLARNAHAVGAPGPFRAKPTESCIARQRGPMGSGTSIWPCLTAYNHEIHEILSRDEVCPPAGLRAHDNNRHGACT